MTVFEAVPSRKFLVGQLLWFTAWLVITIFGLSLAPDPSGHGTHQHLGFPPCPSVLLFDRPCPGCGLTTSWTSLLHGNLALSFAAHPFGPLLYVLFTVSAIACGYGYVRSVRFDSDAKPINLLAKVVVTAFVLFGIGRFVMEPHYATHRERIISELITGNRS